MRLIDFLGKPKEIDAVACSGGPDSMALLSFLVNAGHAPDVLYFDHDTEISAKSYLLIRDYCVKNGLNVFKGELSKDKDPKQSWEEYWRIERYAFFNTYAKKGANIATAHNLDDVVETYLFGAINGAPKSILYKRLLDRIVIIRPLLTTLKHNLELWCDVHNVSYVVDPSNEDIGYPRNRLRHVIIPEILKINPGLKKVIKKSVVSSLKD